MQVLNAKEENSSSPVPVTALENDQQTIISRSNATTDATSIQHGGENDVKVEVHRKNSVSSDPTTLVLDVHCEKVDDLSAVTSTTVINQLSTYLSRCWLLFPLLLLI